MQLSIHGHFYQPDRVNPFTSKVPDDQNLIDQTNGKYKNWNEQINAQCYTPNAQLGNFSHISFNLYRSLFDWLKDNSPQILASILRSSHQFYQTNGIGNALAGSYNHSILPFLNDLDLQIEISWGIQHFIHYFKYEPLGFWLAETAVSQRVLDCLAEHNIKLTILSQHQAEFAINPEKMYFTNLNQNRRIAIAFYNKHLSDALSFDNTAMQNADQFIQTYVPNKLSNQGLLLGATDGERYGHHLVGGEKFLQQLILSNNTTTLLEYYQNNTIKDSVNVKENSSWSCLCGDLKRWKQDCDCCVDYNNNQRVSGEWKVPLFNIMHQFTKQIQLYTDNMLEYLVEDPISIQKNYIQVILKNVSEEEYLNQHKKRSLTPKRQKQLSILLQIIQYRLATFTSCAWFFWDLDRPEPRIVIANARKVLQLLLQIEKERFIKEIEDSLLSTLATIKSTHTGKSGLDLYNEYGGSVLSANT